MPVRLMVVEDQGMVRGALAALLNLQTGFAVVSEQPDGQAALHALRDVEVDLILADIEMPGLSGLELAAEVQQRFKPAPKFVLLSTFARAGYVKRAQTLGVDGYLLKESPAPELAQALRRVMRGKTVYDPALQGADASLADPLSDRERQALRWAEQGLTTADIAEQLHRSEGTVRNLLSDAIRKLECRNRTEAVRKARERGWL